MLDEIPDRLNDVAAAVADGRPLDWDWYGAVLQRLCGRVAARQLCAG
jgi:hypothetical protein